MPTRGFDRYYSLGCAIVSRVPAFAAQTLVLNATRLQVLAPCVQLVGHKKAATSVVQGALAVRELHDNAPVYTFLRLRRGNVKATISHPLRWVLHLLDALRQVWLR